MPFTDDLNLTSKQGFKDDLGLTPSGFVDDLNLVKKPSGATRGFAPSFEEKAVEFLTAGHIPARPIIEPTIEAFRERPELQAEYAPEKMGIFEDPAFFGGMGLAHGVRTGVRVAAPLATKLAKGAVAAGREAIGWMTGGVSEVPTLAKAGAKGITRVAEIKPLAALREARVGKPFAEVPVKAVMPEKGIVEGAIKAGEKAAPRIAPAKPVPYKSPSPLPEPGVEVILYRRGREGGRWWSTDKEYTQQGFAPMRGDRTIILPANVKVLDAYGDYGKFEKLMNKSELAQLSAPEKWTNRILKERIYDDVLKRNKYDAVRLSDEAGTTGKISETYYVTPSVLKDYPELAKGATSGGKPFASMTPEEFAGQYGLEARVTPGVTGGEYGNGRISVGDSRLMGKANAGDWTGKDNPDFVSVNEYPENIRSSAHETAHGIFTQDAAKGHVALKELQTIGVPKDVAFESLVDSGGLYLLEPEAITNPKVKGILDRWLGKSPSPLPEAGAPSGGKQPWEMTRDELDVKYTKAGDIVDGRKVRSEIPNMDSIESSLENSTVLPGIYEIPLSEFEGGLTGTHYSASGTKRIAELADQIAKSKEINPLIVVIDKDGPYILEGGTRAEALYKSGAKSFPAKVVLDEGSFYEATKQAIKEGKPVPPEVLKDYPELAKPSGITTLATEQQQVAQAGKIVVELGKKEAKPSYSFAASETEALFQSAKGIHPEGIIEKIKNVATEVGHKFTRDFEHLALKKENSQLIFDLKRLEKQKDVVADRTVRSIGETLSGLGKPEYEIFSRKVILDDLMSDYKRGLYTGDKDLPFKFTPESLSAEIGKLDALISTKPVLSEALSKRKAMWEQVKTEYVDAMTPYKVGVEGMFKENYYRHQVLDYIVNNGIFGTGKRLRTPTRGYMKGRTGAANLYNTDYLEVEHQIMAQMLHDVETAKTLTKIQAGEDIIKEVRAQAKTAGLADWHKAIPEGYNVWQPKEGNVFYPVLTVNEKTAERIMTGQMDEILEGGGKIFRDVLAVGGKRKEWVVRNEVAETLDNLVRERTKGLLSSADLGVMTAWKKWQLISPRRYFKYQTRNLTGDAEAVFLGNISGFGKVPQAVKELGEVFFQKKSMSPDMAAWFERGGISSTLQAQEMDAIKPMWMFSRLHEKRVGDLNLWKKYWNTARLTTDFRESILRYANFLDYKSQLVKGKGIPKNYGASKPDMINALKDIDDKAFWLSNDLLGAYDRVSVAGQTIRERLIPFWSWQEVNFKRYIQLYKNATNDGDLATTVGKQLGAKTAMTALKVGRLAIKTAAFASMLQVYNHTFFPEEEKLLPTDMKSTPHMVFGRDDKGNIQYFNRMGTLDDFISWFGLDYAPRFIGEYLDGKKSMKELLQSQAKKTYESPINKVVQGSAPFMKLLGETISRKSTFPDVFQPGTVRDRWYHIARSFGLENEYNLMAGKPSGGYGESLKNLFIYKIDPGEAAFRDVYDMKSDFMKKLGRTSEGFWLTPTGDALYNMKLSIKYDDKEAFSKYLTEYITLATAQGKTKEQIQQGIKTSIQAMHPLYNMNEQLKNAFIGSLNYEDQGTLAQAIGFYNDILTGKPDQGIE